MNALLILTVTWVGKEHRFAGLDWSYLVVLGMIGTPLSHCVSLCNGSHPNGRARA